MESELLAKINVALGPLLGADRFRASVNADCDFTSSEENEESVDASKSAILTSQTSEESSGGAQCRRHARHRVEPATPDGARRVAGRRASSVEPRTPAYQPSRTVKHTTTPKGTVRRISTAVLVDQTVRWDGAGAKARRTLIPPSADVLKGVHDIIAGITGFTEQRGDQITVETLPFETTLEAGTARRSRHSCQAGTARIRLQDSRSDRRRGCSRPAGRRPDFRSVAQARIGASRRHVAGGNRAGRFRRRRRPGWQNARRTRYGTADRGQRCPPGACWNPRS